MTTTAYQRGWQVEQRVRATNDPGNHIIPGDDLRDADHLLKVMLTVPKPYAFYSIWVGETFVSPLPLTMADAFAFRNIIAIMEGQPVIEQAYYLTRGDQWNGPVITFTKADDPLFDFTGSIVSASLVINYCQPGPTYVFAITLDTSVIGQAVTQLVIPPEDSATLPCGVLLGNVKLELTVPNNVGPFTWVKFQLTVQG